MKKISYEQAREDHEYLWSIGEAYDMTGGYTDQEDLERLLKNPTKAMACDCYCRQIHYWFTQGPEPNGYRADVPWDDARVVEIGLRHRIQEAYQHDPMRDNDDE
ncbi:hypothetical protein G6L37_34985 [Agrobacterium rubi]|nr:hypothetical protein [Agrobacterium rubi]NTF23775.1 hypothetical protein [Agrobacterium rubi]